MAFTTLGRSKNKCVEVLMTGRDLQTLHVGSYISI